MNKKIIIALQVLSLTTIFCTFQPSGLKSPTPNENGMMNATLTAKAAINNTQDATIPTVPESPETGSISGYLSFPSEFLPPMRVVAFNATDYSIYYFVDTVQGQSDYTIPGCRQVYVTSSLEFPEWRGQGVKPR